MMFSSRLKLLFPVALLGLVGCSDGGPKTVPVYGRVTFADRDVPQVCRLFFQPVKMEGASRPSAAEAKADGSYKVTAFRRSDGLLPGTYRVHVSYFDLKPGANPELDASWIELRYDAGELVVDASARRIEHNVLVPSKG